MIYQMQLIKGLFRPRDNFYSLSRAEQIRGLWPRMAALVIFSVVLSFLSSFLGIQGESVSAYLADVNQTAHEWQKMLFAIGASIWGLLYPLLFIFIPALLFWTFLEVDFRKVLALQSIVFLIYLIEMCLVMLLNWYFAIPRESSPFSLGVLVQQATDKQLIISFFSSISIFRIWAIILQYQFLKGATEREPRFVFLLIMTITIFFWVFSALFTSIHIERLFS
ncbi:hypothetical protein [Bacillus xiapuensis]|uniref:hypothetical protein n=1 Tax=Bacillus xiapuensis TaxID=2014075 RepID=UPI000C23B435|nr:hypothetical protein [Bacillus xiapuensis]